MAIEIVFWTQVASFIGFVVTLFGLYRVLVSQKDASIQLLKEKNEYLSFQLSEAKEKGPDALAESLSKRVSVYEKELEKLNSEKIKDSEKIHQKEIELSQAKEEATKFSVQLSRATDLMEDFFCPECGAVMIQKEYHSESVWHSGREIDVEHEYLRYECGFEIIDGKPNDQHPEMPA